MIRNRFGFVRRHPIQLSILNVPKGSGSNVPRGCKSTTLEQAHRFRRSQILAYGRCILIPLSHIILESPVG